MKNPTTKGRVSRVSFADWTPEAPIPLNLEIQLLVACYAFRTEMAGMLAAAVVGGRCA